MGSDFQVEIVRETVQVDGERSYVCSIRAVDGPLFYVQENKKTREHVLVVFG